MSDPRFSITLDACTGAMIHAVHKSISARRLLPMLKAMIDYAINENLSRATDEERRAFILEEQACKEIVANEMAEAHGMLNELSETLKKRNGG